MNFGNKLRVAILKYNENAARAPGDVFYEVLKVLKEYARHYDQDYGRSCYTSYNLATNNVLELGLMGLLADTFLDDAFSLMSCFLSSREAAVFASMKLVRFCREHNVDVQVMLRRAEDFVEVAAIQESIPRDPRTFCKEGS